MRIFVVADNHYHPDMAAALPNLDAIVSKANELNCDLLIGIGDLLHQAINTGAAYQTPVLKDNEVEDRLSIIFDKFDNFNGQYGWIASPGNHEFQAYIFEELLTRRYWFKLIGDVLFLIFSTGDSFSYYWGYVSAKQLDDLSKIISNYKTKVPIALGHHPLALHVSEGTGRGAGGFQYWNCRNYKAVREVLKTHPRLKVILSGHIWPSVASYITDADGVNYVCKRHGVTFPAGDLQDMYVVEIDPATGSIDVDVWRFDANDRVDVLSVTV